MRRSPLSQRSADLYDINGTMLLMKVFKIFSLNREGSLFTTRFECVDLHEKEEGRLNNSEFFFLQPKCSCFFSYFALTANTTIIHQNAIKKKIYCSLPQRTYDLKYF